MVLINRLIIVLIIAHLQDPKCPNRVMSTVRSTVIIGKEVEPSSRNTLLPKGRFRWPCFGRAGV